MSALAEARERVSLLMKELALDRAELRPMPVTWHVGTSELNG